MNRYFMQHIVNSLSSCQFSLLSHPSFPAPGSALLLGSLGEHYSSLSKREKLSSSGFVGGNVSIGRSLGWFSPTPAGSIPGSFISDVGGRDYSKHQCCAVRTLLNL